MTAELNTLWKKLARRFTEDSPAADRLRFRGHSFEDVASRVQLGYFSGSVRMDFEDKKLRMLVRSWEDRKALVYPLRSLGGHLYGLVFESCAKTEKSTRDVYLVPAAKYHGVFFYTDDMEWEKLQKSRFAVVVEGSLDVLALSKHCSCVFGTNKAFVSEGQLRSLSRWCDTLYAAQDNDATGDEAASALTWKSKGVLRVSRVKWPKKDPQELHESGKLLNVVRAKLPALTWKE